MCAEKRALLFPKQMKMSLFVNGPQCSPIAQQSDIIIKNHNKTIWTKSLLSFSRPNLQFYTKTDLAVEERSLNSSHRRPSCLRQLLLPVGKRLRYCCSANTGGLSAGLGSSANKQHSSLRPSPVCTQTLTILGVLLTHNI